jgi:hypothetical protein
VHPPPLIHQKKNPSLPVAQKKKVDNNTHYHCSSLNAPRAPRPRWMP